MYIFIYLCIHQAIVFTYTQGIRLQIAHKNA